MAGQRRYGKRLFTLGVTVTVTANPTVILVQCTK